MKNWRWISSIIQLCIGIAAVAAYIVIALGGEPIGKWTVTLILVIVFIILGVIGIIDWVKQMQK